MESKSSEYSQKFDKFLQAKGPSSAAKSGVSSSASSSFERFSAQFDKRFGQSRQSSIRTVDGTSSAAAVAAAVGVADTATVLNDVERQQSFTLGSSSTGVIFSRNSGSHLKARDLFLESTKKYNIEQDLYCHEGAHPDSYKLHELDDHSCVSSRSFQSGGAVPDKEVGLRPSEQSLKDKAFYRNIFDFIKQDYTCPPSCQLKGQCMNSVLFRDVMKELTWFWGGDHTKKAYTTSDRRGKIVDKMKRSVFKDLSHKRTTHSLSSSNDDLHLIFRIGSSNVCESVYLQLIGHPCSKLWQRCKKELFKSYSRNNGYIPEEEIKSIDAAITMKRHKSERRSQPKADSARSFITYLVQFYSSLSPNEGEEHIRILPFETHSHTTAKADDNCMASKETFRKEWKQVYKTGQVKLSRGKGTFPTCDICNNANDMLSFSKSSKWTKRQREIIISFKSHHLKQQAAERAALEGLKRIACMEWTTINQPKMALFFGDAMTNHASKTPKYGKRHGKAEAAFFQNRVFGFEVYCGPIQGEILIHSDELVRNGANYNIEVHRLVLAELSRMLKELNLLMPNEVHFQLDNCGDNKNKEFFMFCSILVEAGYFQTVTVGFLIVGHTHASIDQYFSCLRRKIRNASFIASPMALQHLFSLPFSASERKKSRFRKPLSQLQLYFVHDYRSALAPYYNPAITSFNIPYQFKFFNVLSKCVCQHKQFADSKLPWLPLQSSEVLKTVDQLYKARVFSIENTHSLSTENGKSILADHMGFRDKVDTSRLGNSSTGEELEKFTAFNDILPELQQIESYALAEQVLRHEDEASGINDIERYDEVEVRDAQRSNQEALQSLNTKTHGFLFWIDYMVKPELPPPPLITMVKPVPINPRLIWEQFKSPEIEQNLIEVETSALEYLTVREEKQQGQEKEKTNADSDSDEESIFGEIAKRAAEQAASVGKKKRKKTNHISKSDGQFIMQAVANIKAAVRFMRDVKIKSNVVNTTSKSLAELPYEKVFTQKTVTIDDMNYFAARESTESILNIVQVEIDKQPEFEWFSKATLSEEQLRIMELQQVLLVQQAAEIREACNKVLVRRKESTERETITRVTNEKQRKEEAKAIEKQLREEQKEATRERKQAERERMREEKEASKSSKQAEKKKRTRAVSTKTAVVSSHSSSTTEEKKENEYQQSESMEADDRTLRDSRDTETQPEETLELSTSTSGNKATTSILTNIAQPKGLKEITEYSNKEQTLIKKVQQVIQRVLNKPTSNSNQPRVDDTFPQTKRRAANSEEEFVQAIIMELNWSQYKASYMALVDYFDLAIPGNYSTTSQFSTESERKIFLQSFAKAYYQKLHWER